MTKDPMTKEILMTNDERMKITDSTGDAIFGFRNSSFLRYWVFRQFSFILFIVSCSACSAQEDALRAERAENATPRVKLHNWPRFHGPNGSGISTGPAVPIEWNRTKNVAWKTAIPGPGSSSPIIWGDHIYLTYFTDYGTGEFMEEKRDVNDLKRHIMCVDRVTGKVQWQHAYPLRGNERGGFDYDSFLGRHGKASSTPAVDRTGVYAWLGSSGMAAVTHDGNQKWIVDIKRVANVGVGQPFYGTAGSVLLYKDLVIVPATGIALAMVALDKATGREVWRHEAVQYATPVIARANGKDELVFQYKWGQNGSGKGKIAAVDPQTGKLLWECFGIDNYQNPSPVAKDGIVYVTAGLAYGTMAIRCGGRGDVTDSHVLWKSKGGSIVVSPLFHDSRIYLTGNSAQLLCFNAANGDKVYEARMRPVSKGFYASPVLSDGKIFCVSKLEGTYIFDTEPEIKQIAHNVIEGDNTAFHGTPAISDGRLYLRSRKFLYCIGTK